MISWSWDGVARAGYMKLREGTPHHQCELVNLNVIFDCDADGGVLGIEFLGLEDHTQMWQMLPQLIAELRV